MSGLRDVFFPPLIKSAASAFWPSAVLGCPVKHSSQGVKQLGFYFIAVFGWRGWKRKGSSVCKRFYGRANDAYYKVYHPRKLQQDRFAEYKRESLLWVPCWVLATGSPISLRAALCDNVVGSRQAGCCLFYECHIKHTQKNSGTPIKKKKRKKKITHNNKGKVIHFCVIAGIPVCVMGSTPLAA